MHLMFTIIKTHNTSATNSLSKTAFLHAEIIWPEILCGNNKLTVIVILWKYTFQEELQQT